MKQSSLKAFRNPSRSLVLNVGKVGFHFLLQVLFESRYEPHQFTLFVKFIHLIWKSFLHWSCHRKRSIVVIEDSLMNFAGKLDNISRKFNFCDSIEHAQNLACVVLLNSWSFFRDLQKRMLAPDLIFWVFRGKNDYR